MEDNRVFKFIWRANGIFLFIAGMGLIILLLIFAGLLIAESRRWDASPPAISTSSGLNAEPGAFELRLPSQEKTSGSDFTYFELRSGPNSYGSLGSGRSSQLRNIGVYDLKTNKTHWLFPNAQQDIEAFKSVRKTNAGQTGATTHMRTGFLLTVARTLENRSVSRDLWAMSPDGQDLRKILSDIPKSPDIRSYGDTQNKLIISTKSYIDVYPFDVDTLTVGEPTRVSMP